MNDLGKVCPICGKPVQHVSQGGEGIVMYVDTFNSKGESTGIRPMRDEDGKIQDVIHLECSKNAPEGAHFPFWL